MGIGETEQDARDDARKHGHTDAADKAQLIRRADESAGGYYIRECSPNYVDSFRARGEMPWSVNDDGLIDLEEM